MTIRREILWEAETAANSEVLKLERRMIVPLRANNPEIGYHRNPKFDVPAKDKILRI
jgi:hypothetical protein